MPMSVNALRVGKRYRLKNFGEESEFEVLEIFEDDDCRVKDIYSLEEFRLSDLTRYGVGADYDLEEA
ncbi:hypothetical protein FUAX_30520 [Fulvitalea axinellae]|uniref:Uncharacterized protein n=1 Tax=Fulvitalea axinellae TaxID=1182444 RepID=A0AAU9DDT0_9BACT|nr:hypothetical protein FUAX_30520 [Fulvitalea axinellae]